MKLSKREMEIATLLSHGLETREIAQRLRISAGTVDWHRARIFKKLGVHNVAAMTRKIVEAEHSRGQWAVFDGKQRLIRVSWPRGLN